MLFYSDADSNVIKALSLSQLSIQYLTSCANSLKSREKLISKAIETFKDEEDTIDLEIARLK